MTAEDVCQWSFCRAINKLGRHEQVDGLEGECNRALAKMMGRPSSGFYVPNEVMNGLREYRDLSKGTGSAGGYTVQTDVLGKSFIELLRNTAVCLELGARRLGGLVGDVSIPSQNGGATAYWVGENDQTTKSNLTFGQVGLTPHRLSATTVLGKMLIAQSSLDVEAIVRQDFALQLGIAIDAAAIAGTGTSGEPLGILGTPGIGAVTFGGAADYAHIIDFETQLTNQNVSPRQCAYVTTPAVKAKLKDKPKIGSTFPTYIWEPTKRPGLDGRYGEVNGYAAVATKQVPRDAVLFGSWSDLIIADWVGMDVVVDPYTLADRHQLKITINMLIDVALRHVGAFTVSTDSGAQ